MPSLPPLISILFGIAFETEPISIVSLCHPSENPWNYISFNVCLLKKNTIREIRAKDGVLAWLGKALGGRIVRAADQAEEGARWDLSH